MTNLGRSNPHIYYNIIPRKSGPAGGVFVLLKAGSRAHAGVVRRLSASSTPLPARRISVTSFENGPPLDAPIAVRLVARRWAC